MRIAFDAKRLYNNFTGLGNHSRTTIDILREFYPETECLLFTPHIKESAVTSSYLDRDGCRTIMPHGVVRGGLWRTFFMSSDIRKEKPDIFHGLSNELPTGLDIPSAVTIHDVAFRTFKDMYHWNDRITYDLKWKHACRWADMIIAISESTRKDIISFYDADPDKVCTVYQPVNRLFYSDGGEKRPDFLTEGTGGAAAVEGYKIAGKTGTAQKYDKEGDYYVISFEGFAPYDNPEVVCYVAIDEPATGDASRFSSELFSNIMTEVLSYLNIAPDDVE